MSSLKAIRKRIASVRNTRKITRAMKLVAAAKLRRAQQAMQELQPYARKHRELLGSLAEQLRAGAEELHPLMVARPTIRTVAVLAINSDRGMCGAFNGSAQKLLTRYVKQRRGDGVERVVVYPLGRRMTQFARKSGLELGTAFGEVIGAADDDRLLGITDTLTKAFLAGEVDEVVVLVNRFRSAISQVPETMVLLPVSGEGGGEEAAGGELIYEPGQQALLRYVVPRYVEVQVRQAILESIAGEFAARMNAMTTATDNASEMINQLTLQANRARQAAITTELMEIIGGAEAMS